MRTAPHRHVHLWLMAAMALIVAGFWPSFFATRGTGSRPHDLHGLFATGWTVLVIAQAWLASRGLRTAHRALAVLALLTLMGMVITGLQIVAVMQHNPHMPPSLPPLLAFIDFATLAWLLALVALALANRRRPAAHKRYMACTVLLGFPPAVARLLMNLFAPDIAFPVALHASFVVPELVLAVLVWMDRRAGLRLWAYPLTLAFFIAVQGLMGPVAATEGWQNLMRWYGTLA